MNTVTDKDHCAACAEACEITGMSGVGPFEHPWIGRPPSQLMNGDVVRSFGPGDPVHALGDITREGSKVFVQWRDRVEREPLGGAITLCLLRADERVPASTRL